MKKNHYRDRKVWRLMGNDEKIAASVCKALHREFTQETQELVDTEF